MIVGYDFEVFRYNWLLKAIDAQTGKVTTIWDDADALREFYEKNKTGVLVGFNSRQYDIYIMQAILCGYSAWDMNEHIIVKGRDGYTFSSMLRKFPINNFDCLVGFNGLKTLEAFMGKSVVETSVPFDIDRPLTPQEKKMTEFYCESDVENTLNVFLERYEEFESHLALIKMFDLPLSDIGKTKAQLSAKILGARRVKRKDEFDIHFPENLQIGRYQAVLDFFKNDWNYDKSLVIDVAGIPHCYGTGGIHGAKGNVKSWSKNKSEWYIDPKKQIPYVSDGEFLHIDVASYYPSLMIEYPEYCMSRNIPDPSKFREIRDKRVAYKREKNKLAAPLKIVLNSTYGATKDRFNPLYDPRQANHTCIWGQLFLTDLIDKLEDHCEIINSNTDGLIVKIDGNYDEIVDIVHKFEERTHLTFEIDRAVRIIQRNVNNYACVMEDGKVESKGGMLKQPKLLDNDLPIVQKAVLANLIEGKNVEDIIFGCDDLIEFQKVYKLSSAFDYVTHNGQRYTNKCYRVFASRSVKDGILYKYKNESPNKFANCPDRVKIVNDDIIGVKVPMWLDKKWYVDEAYKRINRFYAEGDCEDDKTA